MRASAFEKLTAGRGTLSVEVMNALVDLMDRENQLIDSTFRASQGQEGTSVKYGEAYGEYYSTLGGLIQTIASATRDARTLQVLARGSYNPDSPLSLWLARVASVAVVSTLLDVSDTDIAPKRQNAVAVLGRILAEHRNHGLSEETVVHLKQTLLRATVDDDAGVRIEAVQLLALVSDKTVIPLLEKIADGDPAAIPAASGQRFPVREAARKALKLIRGKY